ncbi:hypothetical protein AN393_02373 [Pseudoalteromonas sp. P1-25]|nr:hypothetical protein AN393_02373 [Pseudoalteromonas sp. P1-25]
MSVDPFIQSPLNSQSLNPYTYIMNNPMTGVDPTGYVAQGTNASNWRTSGCDLDPMGCTSTPTEKAFSAYVGSGESNMHQSFSDNLEKFNNRMEQQLEDNWTDHAYAGLTSATITDLPSGTSGEAQPIQRISYGDGQTFVIDPNNQTATLVDSDGNVVSSTNRDDPNYAGQQMAENWIMTGLTALLPRMFKTMNIRGGAKGLVGKDFEDWLTKKLGGNGGFMIGGRDIDGGVGNTWWKAKLGQYWDRIISKPKLLEKFKSDMGARLRIATDNNKIYQLHSNTPIPKPVQTWLDKKGITYFEHLD